MAEKPSLVASLLRPDLAFGALLGAFVTLFGLWQAIPALSLLPSSQTVSEIQSLAPVSPGQLDKLIEAERTALPIRGTAGDWSNLGIALALKSEQGDQDHALLNQSKDALKHSLELAPANPYLWIRLAIIDAAQEMEASSQLDEWRMSVMAGPNELRLGVPRTVIAIPLWDYLNTSDRQAVFTDIRNGWRSDPLKIMTLANSTFSTNVIRASLASDLPILLTFEKALKDRQKK